MQCSLRNNTKTKTEGIEKIGIASLEPVTEMTPTGIEKTKLILSSASGHKYELTKVIKQSIYGVVMVATELTYDDQSSVQQVVKNYVAIKIYLKNKVEQALKHGARENPFVEMAALQLIDNGHKCILGHIECCEDEEKIYLIMPLFSSKEMFDYIDEHGALTEAEVKKLFRQLLEGIQYLHSIGIAHRDISLENILFDQKQQEIKLIDFGMSLLVSDDCPITNTSMIAVGKRNYIPPEMITLLTQPYEEVVDPFQGDIWSAGVCLLFLLLGFPPVDIAHESDMRFQMLQSHQLSTLLHHWHIELSPGALSVAESMLQVEASKRPSAKDLLLHPWLQL